MAVNYQEVQTTATFSWSEQKPYRYGEDRAIAELQDYIDSTYSAHYAKGEIQAGEFIESAGHGLGYYMGNIMKYADRFGKKDGYNRKDLLKIAHYTLMALNLTKEDTDAKTCKATGTRKVDRCERCSCDKPPRS